jgi:hypothetical protein
MALLSSGLLCAEDSHILRIELSERLHLTPSEISSLDLPAINRVEALLRSEFLEETQLRELACDFAGHTLHVFEQHAPGDRRPHECVEAARLYFAGASLEGLQEAIKEAIPAVWRFDKTEFIGAFTAGLAATFLDYQDAAEMARVVALHAQRAAHRKEWESRESDLELIIGREKEATWQLTRIVKILA